MTDSIQQGQLPLLQSYLKDRCGTQTAVLDLIVDHGLHKALEYLKRKKMKEAGQMLANLVSSYTNCILMILHSL